MDGGSYWAGRAMTRPLLRVESLRKGYFKDYHFHSIQALTTVMC